MSLPPALLMRLASRGLVNQKHKTNGSTENDHQQKSKSDVSEKLSLRVPSVLPPFSASALTVSNNSVVPGSEEVIAEDYDELEYPSQFENYEPAKRPEENYWIERMKLRIGDNNFAGFKGCPNKYNIYHKCTLFCVNRWENRPTEPSRDYMVRYKRLTKKYPVPKGWMEVYDVGCGSFYFWNTADNAVSWLPPTHPKSQITKSAAVLRRQLEEALPINSEDEEEESDKNSDDSAQSDDDGDRGASIRSTRDFIERAIGDLTNLSMRRAAVSPVAVASATPPPLATNAGGMEEPPMRKQKSRDIEKTLQKNRQHSHNQRNRRLHKGGPSDSDPLDPMDPSSYSDIPRGKWSDGLNTVRERDASASQSSKEPPAKKPNRDSKQESKSDEDD